MTTPTPPRDDAPHDEHLRAALRHAPDRDVQPSEALNARILRTAHAAAARATAPEPDRARHVGWQERLSAWLGALARPGPSAAFASLALATVIGVMWRDGPPPEREAGSPMARQAPAPAQPRADAAVSEALSDGADRSVAAQAARSPARRPDGSLGGQPSAARAEPETQARPANSPPAAAPAQADATTQADSTARARSAELPTERRAGPRPAPDPAATGAAPGATMPGEPASAAEPPMAKAAPPTAATAATAATADETRGASVTAAAASHKASVLDEMQQRDASSTAQLRVTPEPFAQAPAPQADPLAPLAAAWAGTGRRTGTDLASAIDTLRQLTHGLWRPLRQDAPQVSLGLTLTGPGGEPQGVLHLADDHVVWRPAGPGALAWQAPMPPGAAARLRPALGFAPAAVPASRP